MSVSSKSSSYNIPKTHNIDNHKLGLWLDKADISIKNIAIEFIMKTVYISYKVFFNILQKCTIEMLSSINSNILQFYLASDDVNYRFKSSYWIIKQIKTIIDISKYTIKIVTKINDLDLNETIIFADDASYSGSQISNFFEEFTDLKCNIYILIPFISNTAIDTITSSFFDNNIKGSLNFVVKNRFVMKPIYQLMNSDKIIKLFKFYSKNGTNIREYPIYFDHKVADNYSSFPLIYTYGIIPNIYNQKIILDCIKNLKPLKTKFNDLERIVFLKNCDNTYHFDIHKPSCPIPPYKINFKKLSKSMSKKLSLNKAKSTSKAKSKAKSTSKAKTI